MRQPRNHAEVAHRWASREVESGSQGNMSFRNGTIYSFNWWDMANNCETKDGKPYVIMAGYSYSSFTSRHMKYVRQAIPAHIPVYYSTEKESSYYGRGAYPILTDKAVLTTMLKSIEESYNSFCIPKNHGKRQSTDDLVLINRSIYASAVQFSSFIGVEMSQDFDKYLISDHEVRIMNILVAPVIKRMAQRINEAEEKERLLNEAHNRLILKYGKDPMQLAKDWIAGKIKMTHDRVLIPPSDPDAIFCGCQSIFQNIETAMRIEGDQIVTNHSARVSLAAGKRLWGMMKNHEPIIGEKVDIYSVVKNNGELVIGCHHIKREIVDYFVEYYNW